MTFDGTPKMHTFPLTLFTKIQKKCFNELLQKDNSNHLYGLFNIKLDYSGTIQIILKGIGMLIQSCYNTIQT